ncbi:sulfatase [Halorubrum ezzemoulense]|nr:sulfatase [Halorubrum ezzemoulense]MDB9250749.1 sulfatase [Halorubrum ezzemoulense]MDB9264292.1 sulfatase [Halorubrum ezzemoulense]MDB9274740.1 sulfatase [Halorubrum ezzemoulense]MDB9288547.1 sulfatase [Halorubrum ezzemoulense]MDB9295665.1 sulfatase [Halorubrum ezzemoulense]
MILLVMDTARYDFVGGEKNGVEVAPEINRLAESGTKFTNAFSAAPWTLPSHGSLFTGQYPSKHGAHADSKHLPEESMTIAEAFSSAGYDTVGASNNAWISESFGFGRGFDDFYKGWQYVQSETDLGKAGLMNEGTDMWRAVAKEVFNGNIAKNLVNAVYAKLRFGESNDDGAERTNEWVTDWISSHNSNDPFFMFINYLEPHLDYSPPREVAERFLPDDVSYEEAMDVPQNAWKYVTGQLSLTESEFEILECLYAAEIAYTDAKIGELVDHLKSEGEWDDTILLILGDHGENIGDHGLMDHQYCLYDSLLHVPLVAHGGPFTGRGVNEDLIQLTDIAPTLLSELNIKSPEFHNQTQATEIFDGERESVIAEYVAPQPSRESIEKRVGDPDNVMDTYDRSLKTIRNREFKFIRGSDGSTELFNIADDPQEQDELSADQPDIVAEMSDELDTWEQSFAQTVVDDDNDVDESTQERLEDLGYI